MAKFIRLHDRRNKREFLINIEYIITICEYRIGDNYAWTNVTTMNENFEVTETEQDILNKMG